MTTQTQEEFFLANAVDGELTDKQMAQMLNLPEGDSGEQPQSGTPEPTAAPVPTPAPVVTPPVATPEPTQAPVILAKDGVHTIGYEKLVEAREAEKAAKQESESLRAQLAAAQATPAATAAPVATPAPVSPDRFGDFSDEALAKGIEELVQERVAAIVDAKVAEKMAPLERRTLEDATSKHWTTVLTAHPNLDAMVESQELEKWITEQPFYAQPGIRAVIDGGTADQVVQVFDSFVKATGKTAEPTPQPTAAPATDLAAKAAEAIAKAASRAPSSLSEIPGSSVNHDEAAAMLEMTPMAQMRAFEGKTPDQIHALMSKIL